MTGWQIVSIKMMLQFPLLIFHDVLQLQQQWRCDLVSTGQRLLHIHVTGVVTKLSLEHEQTLPPR